MATPVKPVGQFPHSMIPNSKFKFAEKMSRSMIIPKMSASYAMVESTVSNSSRLRKFVSTNQMSQSTAPSIGGFVIASSGDTDNLMEQSLIISKMMETSELTKQSRPGAFDCSSNSSREATSSSAAANTTSSNLSLPSQVAQELSQSLSQSRKELDTIAQRSQPPSSLPNSTRPQQFGGLAPVPELSTPGTNAVSPNSTPSNDLMTRSRLFQEFASKKQMQESSGNFLNRKKT